MNLDWGLTVVLYLFLAGMAGGLYFTSAMHELFTGFKTETVKKGYTYSFYLLIVAVFLLILDLERPARFFHMMLAFKFFSPMSMGSWMLLFFGINTFLTMAMNSDGALKRYGEFFIKFVPYRAVILTGVALSVFLAAYTGVLLGETTKTIWSATPFLGAMFLASGISCGVCLLMILQKHDTEFVKRGKVLDNLCLVVELTVILFFVLALTLGYAPFPEASRFLFSIYGFLFIVGGVILGAIVPIIINVRGQQGNLSPALVLIGAFLLRFAIVYAGQS